jgi:hypothetical protein
VAAAGAAADGAVADGAVAADCAAVRVIADCTANSKTHRLIPLAASPSRIPTSKPTRVQTLLVRIATEHLLADDARMKLR